MGCGSASPRRPVDYPFWSVGNAGGIAALVGAAAIISVGLLRTCWPCSHEKNPNPRLGTAAMAASAVGGILSIKDGTHIAKLALLGNYMATSFVTAADGHGGTLVTEAPRTAQQSLLSHPPRDDTELRNARLFRSSFPTGAVGRARNLPQPCSAICGQNERAFP